LTLRAGELRRAVHGIVFTYSPDYGGPDVATTLPRGQPVTTSMPGAVPPFFAGLLPEGRRLTALRRAIKTSADDELSLLIAVGQDSIGDVQVVPPNERPSPPAAASDAADLNRVRFADVFAQVLSPDPADRVGLPGVQDKLSGRMIALPLTWRETPCILKLDPPEYPQLVQNEAFFYEAARASGLAAPDTEVVYDADGSPGLLVRRFDRHFDGVGGWRNLAQEDGCQVLGRYPADKYRVSSEEVVLALSSKCGAPLVAARDLVRQLVFAYLTCNGDAHAKNLSILQHPDGEWMASPAYDLPSTHAYGDTTMALAIDGRDREDIGRNSFLALGASAGLPTRVVERVVDEVLNRVPSWLDRLDELPYDERRVHKVRMAIAYRVARLSRSLRPTSAAGSG